MIQELPNREAIIFSQLLIKLSVLNRAIIVLPSESRYEDSKETRHVHCLAHRKASLYVLAVILMVPCYRWGNWPVGHMPVTQ